MRLLYPARAELLTNNNQWRAKCCRPWRVPVHAKAKRCACYLLTGWYTAMHLNIVLRSCNLVDSRQFKC
ncbi:hypothetical protein HID58_003528 [Brassica napus]|uniref:Uncharacterized protein n=1 Tax=Brassica napus TaxID=3708 RepID=A0ABQ8EQC4_BRANA|nr:hypothetical protein HID58_003528 [Brassica napus]